MTFILTRFVSNCLKARATKDVDRFNLVVNNLGSLPVQRYNLEQMAAFDCQDESERAVVSVLRPEYTELFACKSKCQFESPHGVLNGVTIA